MLSFAKNSRRKVIKAPKVSTETWESLYTAAQKFKKLKPWEFMDDSDLFGVEDPVSGQVNYCCVMGSAGEVFGLCVYRGREGLDFYLRLMFDELDPELDDVWAIQDAMVTEFANRYEMENEDLDVIKVLGLKFRGKNNYPLFRSHVPGYFPWFLTEDEAVFLTLALTCACDLYKRIDDDPDILTPPDGSRYFTYFLVEEGKDQKFVSRWEAPLPLSKDNVNISSLNELQIKRIQKHNYRKDSRWEIGTFYTPSCITDRDRPYWTRLCLVARQENGFIVNLDPMDPEVSPELQMIDTMLKAIEKSSLLPEEIVTIDQNLYEQLKPLSDAFNLKVSLVGELPAIWEAKEDLIKASMSGFPGK